jgi:hypothetical protein
VILRDLVLELSITLERHLSQLCDEKACVTPEHIETRALIRRAKEALTNTMVVNVHLNEPHRVPPPNGGY